MYCDKGRVFVGECEREEACVKMMSVMVKVGVLSNTHKERCPKLHYQPRGVIHSNSRPP